MRVLAGILTPTEGTVVIDRQVLDGGAAEAIDAGTTVVHRKLSLIPEMTVAENILLGSTPTKAARFIDRAELKRLASRSPRRDARVSRPR